MDPRGGRGRGRHPGGGRGRGRQANAMNPGGGRGRGRQANPQQANPQQANAPAHPANLHGDLFDISTSWDAWNDPNGWVPPEDMCPAHVWEGLNGYSRYIYFMRDRLCAGQPVVTLQDPAHPELPARFQSLPLKVRNNYRTFHLRLGVGVKIITVRICWESLYLIGYMNGNQEWLYFMGYDENATSLSYDASYRQIGKYTRRRGETINFGKMAFHHAIQNLFRLRAAQRDNHQIAKGLEVIMSMICEATRFDRLRSQFSVWSVEFRMDELDNFATMWSTLSNQIVEVNNNRRIGFNIIPGKSGLTKVETVHEARIISVLLRQPE